MSTDPPWLQISGCTPLVSTVLGYFRAGTSFKLQISGCTPLVSTRADRRNAPELRIRPAGRSP
jgi:hypothetical protein